MRVLKIQLYEIGVCRCIIIFIRFFSGFFLFCVYTRSPVAGKGVKMLRKAKNNPMRSSSDQY